MRGWQQQAVGSGCWAWPGQIVDVWVVDVGRTLDRPITATKGMDIATTAYRDRMSRRTESFLRLRPQVRPVVDEGD